MRKQLDFRALVHFAQRVVSATPWQREMIVLSHGAFSLEVGERFGPHAVTSYSVWADMLNRWATDFLEKIIAMSAPEVRSSLRLEASERKAVP